MALSEIEVSEFLRKRPADALVVDVREVDEYISGHIPGAVHIPLGEVADRVGEFKHSGPVYVVCQAGGRSLRACQHLADEGLDICNIAGGTGRWILLGGPVVEGINPS